MASWLLAAASGWPPYTCSWIASPPILHLLSTLATPLSPQMLQPPTTFLCAHLVDGLCNGAQSFLREASHPEDDVLPDSRDRWRRELDSPVIRRQQRFPASLVLPAWLPKSVPRSQLIRLFSRALSRHLGSDSRGCTFTTCQILAFGHRIILARSSIRAGFHHAFCLKPQMGVELEYPA
jgi:hypothetical protein